MGNTLSVGNKLHALAGWDVQGQLMGPGRAWRGGRGLGSPAPDDVYGVGGCIASALCSGGCGLRGLRQLEIVSRCDHHGVELTDVCLYVQVGYVWWKVKFSLFITLSCLIPVLWQALHLLRLIQHQSAMSSCLFSVRCLDRPHLLYLSCSHLARRGSRLKQSMGMAELAFLMSTAPPWSHFLYSVDFLTISLAGVDIKSVGACP